MKEVKKIKAIYELPKAWNKQEVKRTVRKSFPDFVLDKIELQPGTSCQLQCPWCYGKNLVPNIEDRAEVPLRAYKVNVLEPVRKIKPLIAIAGLYSEPMLYSDFEKLIILVNEMGFRFNLYTNGLRLSPRMIRAILKGSHPLSYMSLDYSAARHAGVFINDKIRSFIKARDKYNPAFKVNVPMFFNWSVIELGLIQTQLLADGVDAIRYRNPNMPYFPQAGELRKLDPKHVYLDEKPFHRCFSLCNSISIASDGNVYPCSQTSSLYFKHLKLGSIINDSILNIWKHRKAFWQRFDPSADICECNYYENEWNRYCASLTA